MPINTQREEVGSVLIQSDGVSDDYVVIDLALGGNMQTMSVTAQGTWDGADLTYQVSNDNSNWFNAESGGSVLQLSADGAMTVMTQETAQAYGFARLALTSGTVNTLLVVTVFGGRG